MDSNIKYEEGHLNSSYRQEPLNLSSASIISHSTKLSAASIALDSSTTLEPITSLPLAQPLRTTIQTALIMLALCTAIFLSALDTVILTTALPTIAADLQIDTRGFAWIGSSFLLANAASMPIWGKSSDIFGRKPLLLLANLMFMMGSLVSALAHNFATLLAGRAIQGLGSGGLTVLVNIVVSDIFAMRKRGLMLALVSSVWSFASTIGPVMGGALAEKASWRWCFWVNIPLNLTSLLLLTFLLKIHNPRTPLLTGLLAIDWLGALTITSGTIMLLLGLEVATLSPSPSPSPTTITLLLLGTLSLLLFPLIEAKIASHPLIPLRIFIPVSNTCSLLVCFAHGFCYISIAYFLPFYLQSTLSLTPLASGLWSLVTACTLLLTTVACGIYMHATGRYLELILAALAFFTLGFGLFSTFPATLSVPRLVIFQIVIALGIGPLFQAPLVALQAQLQPQDVAVGTATFGFVRMLAAGFSLVVGEILYQTAMRKHMAAMLASGIAAGVADAVSSGSSAAGVGILGSLTGEQRGGVRHAQTESLSGMWVFYTVVAGVGMVAGLGIRRREMSDVHVEMKTGLVRRGSEGEVEV